MYLIFPKTQLHVYTTTLHFSISAGDTADEAFPDIYTIITDVEGIDEHIESLPKVNTLEQNYPNPFNPVTKIQFDIPKASFVILKVYNVLGQEVTTLVNEKREAGIYKEKFDGSKLTSGVYFYRLIAGDFIQTKKFVSLQ